MQHLQDLTIRQLTELYNDRTGNSIKKFRTKDVAISRIEKLLATEETIVVAEKPAVADGLQLPPKPSERKWRPTSQRGLLIEALTRGESWEQLKKMFPQWAEGDKLYKHVRILHSWFGFGVREEAGKVYIYR